MLYKHGWLEKKLREQGRSAVAEILSIRTEGSGNSFRAGWSDDDDLTTSWFLARLELRVTPPGEPPFEVTVRTRLNTLKSRGDTVPVLYDPNDHDKLVVDYEADARAEMDRVAGLRTHTAPESHYDHTAEDLEREVERQLQAAEAGSGASATPTAAASPSRIEQLQQLADLHDRGVLTDAEFAAEKARVLGQS